MTVIRLADIKLVRFEAYLISKEKISREYSKLGAFLRKTELLKIFSYFKRFYSLKKIIDS